MARRTRALNPEQKSVLTAVRRVARQRSRINDAYVTAIVDARQTGVTYASIAEAVGTSSQAVQEIVRRHHKVEQAPAAPESLSAGTGATAEASAGQGGRAGATAVGAPAGAIAAVTGDDDGSPASDSGAAGSSGPGGAQAFPSPAL